MRTEPRTLRQAGSGLRINTRANRARTFTRFIESPCQFDGGNSSSPKKIETEISNTGLDRLMTRGRWRWAKLRRAAKFKTKSLRRTPPADVRLAYQCLTGRASISDNAKLCPGVLWLEQCRPRTFGRSFRGLFRGGFYGFQRGFGRTAQNGSIGAKTRAVAGAIPRLFRAVPMHDATHVRAIGRNRVQLAIFIARACHSLAVQIKNFATTFFHRSG